MDDLKKTRPTRVTLLGLLIALFALLNAVRVGDSIYFWKTLLEYGARPLYLALSGGIWLAAGSLLVWGLWSGKRWAGRAAMIAAVAYAAWYWLDRLLLQQPHSNGTFSIIATAVLLILIFAVCFSGKARRYFLEEAHERQR